MTDPGASVLPDSIDVLVVGAGFSGLGAAVRLAEDGHEVLVLERAPDVGGTWRDNTYPGCGCDVQSHLYSFSFAPNPNWTTGYSLQPEIQAYLGEVADRFDVRRLIRFGVEALACRWDGETSRWLVETSAGPVSARVLVLACGPLAEPRRPDLPGLESFTGTVMHSARWDHDVDLEGARVAVVGTGASAIQIVPELAGKAASLTVFQRTPAWVLPRGNHTIAPWRRRLYARIPAARLAVRGLVYGGREALVVAFVRRPGLMRLAEVAARAHLRRAVADPHLRAVLTPDYRAGCKRILVSDDYYAALSRPQVEVVPSGVAALDGDTVVATDGTRRAVDVVVLATGFETNELPAARFVIGAGGRRLADVWAAEGMQALRGTTVAGFPNLFLMIGPNTGLGHSSMVHVIESQLGYLRDALRQMATRSLAAIEPTERAQSSWNAGVQARLRRTVWNSGCTAWYQDVHGRVTALWPGSTLSLRRQTRRVDLEEYQVTPARTVSPARTVTPARTVSPATGLLAGSRR